uniref:Uncharacterized protein n=1 Tax=Anopheles dirus TaxID=7168 RepID=A0A182NXJ5_9DIPT
MYVHSLLHVLRFNVSSRAPVNIFPRSFF